MNSLDVDRIFTFKKRQVRKENFYNKMKRMKRYMYYMCAYIYVCVCVCVCFYESV